MEPLLASSYSCRFVLQKNEKKFAFEWNSLTLEILPANL